MIQKGYIKPEKISYSNYDKDELSKISQYSKWLSKSSVTPLNLSWNHFNEFTEMLSMDPFFLVRKIGKLAWKQEVLVKVLYWVDTRGRAGQGDTIRMKPFSRADLLRLVYFIWNSTKWEESFIYSSNYLFPEVVCILRQKYASCLTPRISYMLK